MAAAFGAVLILTGCGNANDNVAAGMEAVKNLNYETALSCFEEARENGENERLILRGMGIAYMGLADYGQAASCFEEALQKSNGIVEAIDYDLNYYLAAAYTKGGQAEQAEVSYNAIIALKPEEKDAYFLRGNLLLSLNRYEEAMADFDQAIALNPQDYNLLIQICEVLNTYGYKEMGAEYLQTALQEGDSQISSYDKGRIYYYLGEYQKAYLALEEAKQKGGAEAYLYLGKAYEATGDYNYASSVYNDYLSKDSSNAKVYNQLGLCEMAKGNYEKALEAFQAGMNVENNDMLQTLKFNEIATYEYLGDYMKATVLMESYLTTYPDDENAKREYGFLQSR